MPPAAASRKRARTAVIKTEDEPMAAASAALASSAEALPMETDEAAAGGAATVDAGDGAPVGGVGGASDYESLRRAQIARNQALLSSLTGVASAGTSLTPADHAARMAAMAAADARRKASAALRRKEREERFALMPRRDLPGRRAKTGEVNYNEDKLGAHAAAAAASSSAAAASSSSSRTPDADADPASPPRANADLSEFSVENYPISHQFSSKSSKGVATLPLSVLRAHLGEWIPLLYHSPKAAAMSFLIAGWPSETNSASKRAPPQFNRMSGIQRLANHIALFINVDEEAVVGKEATYGNQWAADGRRITWYAQPTQRVDTPVIGQIIAATRAKQAQMEGTAGKEEEQYAAAILGATSNEEQKEGEEGEAEEPQQAKKKAKKQQKKVEAPNRKAAAAAVKQEGDVDPSMSVDASPSVAFDPLSVLLFLRFAGGAYIYAGPLAYYAHDTRRTPMKFEFTLAEYDTLKTKPAFHELQPDGGKKLQAAAKAAKA